MADPVLEGIADDAQFLVPLPVDGAVDKGALFIAYLSFFGDVQKVADSFSISPAYVQECAHAGNWQNKIDQLTDLKAKEGADALARELNRTANYIQAVRLRNMLDQAISVVTKNKGTFKDFLTNYGRFNDNLSGKACLELVKACQIAQQMTYAALGEAEPGEEGGGKSAGDISLGIMRAVAAAKGTD